MSHAPQNPLNMCTEREGGGGRGRGREREREFLITDVRKTGKGGLHIINIRFH